MKLVDEMSFWLFVATAVSLFAIGFRGLFMIAVSKLPTSGLTSTLAAGA